MDEEIENQIKARADFAQAAKLLESIPGMDRVSASETVAEVGPDVKAFPSASHLSSWAGVCPGNNESAGKRRTSKTTKGNPYFRATLNQSAWASSRKKGSPFQARYQKLSPKLAHKGAIIAVAHALAYTIYNVLAFQRPYKAPETSEMEEAKARRLIRHHQRRLKNLQKFVSNKPKPDFTQVLERLETRR